MAKKPSRYVDPQAPLDNNNLPITSYGSVDSSAIPNFSKSYTEHPDNIADTGTASYVGDQYEHSKYDDPNVYQEDLPNLEDERASNQGTFSALGNATAKFLGKTVMSTVGNLAGTIYGVGSAIGEGKLSNIWDNSFMDRVDAADKGLDNFFKVYKNADYADQNILQKLFLHPTQFTDEATDTASFMAGAILSEIATSGIASETIVPKALKYMKYLSEGAEATEATKALTSFATKGITLAGDLGTSVKHLAMGASYEGIVEARQATMELRDKMYSDWEKDNPNQDMPQNVKDDIDDRLSKAGIYTYLQNLALVGGTNLLLFPKLFGLGHTTSKIAEGAIEKNIIKDAETGLDKEIFETAQQRRIREDKPPHSLLDNTLTFLDKPFVESTKFGVQGAISKTNKEFFDRKHDEDSKSIVNDYLATFGSKLAEEYTTKEGWNNIGMGMIIGALGAPGRGILAPLGADHPLGKYGYKDVTDSNGNFLHKEKLPLWQGGIAGSFDERAQQEAQVGKVVADLNQHTNLFKAMQANYNTMVENNSLQKDQDKALQDGDIFNFQNTKDDQIHSYVSSRIKNNLYDDLIDEVNRMKKLSSDEFYTNFKGEQASDQATNFEKTKFQQETVSNFLERAKNTRDAIKIADDVYKGDNEDLRNHLTHSIAASKNLDLREKLINQSLADLSGGLISNLNLRVDKDGEIQQQLLKNFVENNPTDAALNGKKISQLLEDSKKLRDKRQDYLDLYNHLFTQEGQRQFEATQVKQKEEIQKAQDLEQQKKEDKQKEDIKKDNIKETVKKVRDLTSSELESTEKPDNGFKDFLNSNEDDFDTYLKNKNQGTKEASGSTEITSKTPNTTEENGELTEPTNESKEVSLINAPTEHLDTEETAVIKIEGNNEVKANRDIVTSETGLIRNTSIEHYNNLGTQTQIINKDTRRRLGNTIAYLGIDKITIGQVNSDKNVELRTLDIFDKDGNIEVNKFVEPKLFSQNHYNINSKVELYIPTFNEMEERGLQEYSNTDYNINIDNIEEFPIAIRGEDNKIIGYLPTQSNIKRLVLDEFKEQALADNLSLRQHIFDNKDNIYNSTITSKSPGVVIADRYTNQKSLFEALGDGTKLADKVKIGIIKNPIKTMDSSSKDLYIDNSGIPFKEGDIVNDKGLVNGAIYSILPTSQKGSYAVYPLKTNTIGINNARTIVEAIKLFARGNDLELKDIESLENIKEFSFKNFKDVSDFVNRIIYGSSKADAPADNVFKLYKHTLFISNLDDVNSKFRLEDIATSQEVRNKLAEALSSRYFTVGLKDLNTNSPYISYHLGDNGVIQEKENESYLHYLNEQKALTSNVRGIHINNNEYAFTAQSVIGLANSVENMAPKQITYRDKKASDYTNQDLINNIKVSIIPKSSINTVRMQRSLSDRSIIDSKNKEFYIPEDIAKKAYKKYASEEGEDVQSYEEIIRRGGFDSKELDKLYPSWRSEIYNKLTQQSKLELDEESNISDAEIIPEVDIEENKQAEESPKTEEEVKPSRLTKKKLNIDPNKLKGKSLEDINPILNSFQKDNEINVAPKILKTLALPKIEQLFNNQFLKGNKDKFYNEVTSLGAGKEQTQILKNWIEQNNPKTLDELKVGIAAELSYTTEINTAKKTDYRDKNGWDTLADTMDEEFVQSIRGKNEERNSDYYSNLAVPGGTNYTENEISTPQIEPSIKGHAQFSSDNGIGWFRSDDKEGQGNLTKFTKLDKDGEPYITAEDLIQANKKYRRILEVQSDLFQKGRDRNILVHHSSEANEINEKFKSGILDPEDLAHKLSKGIINQDEYNQILNKTYNPRLTDLGRSKNQFLQLLNKDNNWVNFFVKSIIQDSARKGYEEVHFPTGNTASKIEGHTTLEEHKRNIEQNLNHTKETLGIFKSVLNDKPSVREGDNYKFYYYDKYPGIEGRTEEELKSSIESSIKGQEERLESWQKQYDDIETEGFAKLKPIWNFYENQVQNILKKNYTIERVKDEHGNEWNKVNLDNSHKGQIHFDINPNFSVMNKLFVDLDKFTDSQQREVVDSIIYTLEEGKKDGYSTVEDLFQYAKDTFENTRDYFADLNEDGSFDPTIQKFNDISDNWDKFKEKVLDKLKGIGVKVTKTFETDTTTETDETSDTPKLQEVEDGDPEDNFVSTEANYQKDNYSDTFSQSISSKETASAHLKLKLSLIPEVEWNGNKLEPTVNFLGMGKMMDLNKVWTSLQGVLTGLEINQIYPTIEELAKTNPMYSTILSNIQGDPNTAIQNEFIVAFSKQQTKPVTVKIGYADKASRRTINVFGTNRQGANDILIDNWYDKFKQSPLVQDNGTGELVVNSELGKRAEESFTKFMSNYNPKDLNLAKNLQKGLDYIGINLSLATADNLIKNGTSVDGVKLSGQQFLNRYVSLIFKRLSSGFTEKENLIGDTPEENDNSLALNNPFISETKAITALAKLENMTNPFLYESSYVGGDGKPRYSIQNNSYISKLFNKFNNGDIGIEYVKDKLSTTYAANSIWGKAFIDDVDFRKNFSYHPLDSLGSNETNSPNKTFNRMNTKEKEFTRISLFQNVGRGNSIFLGPIPSDKTTIPTIAAPKIKITIDVDTYEITNRDAKNALYTPFISEYNRIKEVQSQQEDPKFKDKLIAGYHNGMGEKFLVYDFLNKNKELFDSEGKLKIVDPQTLKSIVTPEIQKFATDLIKKQLKYWNKLGLLDKDSPLLDKTYKRTLGDFDDDKHLLRAFAADYSINQFLAHFNYTQLISGDPALHGKKSIEATWINYSKRLAKDIAPGLDGNFENKNFTTIFLKDLSYSSKHLNEYQEVLGDKAKAYSNLNPADAQEYTTLKEHLAIMKAYGKLTPLLEAAGERLLSGGEDSYDINLILQPQKPVYVGTMNDKSMGIDRMYYIKTSAFPLIPALTRGLEIDKLRVAMENSNIDRAVYESGVKLGLGTNSIVTEKSQGEIVDNLDLKGKGTVLDRDGFRLQQEVPYHDPSSHPTINEGSQGRKLILSDVEDDDILHIFNKELSGKEAKQLYENLHIEKMNRAFNQLLSDIGADKNGKIKDLSKLQKILIDEATSRNYNINDVYGLQIETVEGKQRFKIPLAFNNSSNRLESILNSLFTNRVIKSELPGFSKIQGSSAGFSKLRTLDQLNTQAKDSITWLDPKDTELNYIRKSEDGKTLLRADILVPNWFVDKDGKEIDVKSFVKEDGTLDTERLPDNLLTTIGLRIPTQGYNSMMSFRVKGFLPKVVGDLAIVPAEITAQMGSDFDVDKLFMYRYHYNWDGNKLSKIEPPEISNTTVDAEGNLSRDLSKYSNEELDNSIIQYYEDRYKDVNLLPRILEPNGFGDLPDLAKEISSILNLDNTGNFFTTETQNQIHKNNNDGKAGTGIFSLFSTFIKAAQDAKLKLPGTIDFKRDDKILRSGRLYAKGFTKDKSPSTVIMYLQSASVDNAKEQILGSLNINSQTMDVAGTIALTGYDENYIANFLSQPIIREYVEELSNSNDITNPEFKSNAQRELDAQTKILSKYPVSNIEKDEASKIENRFIFSLEEMKGELKAPTNINQVALLNQYLKIKDFAKQIRLVQNAINTDTNGLGIRYVDLQVKANNINLAQESPIDGVDRLFNRTQIAKASEILNKALDIYSNILPYNTPAYRSTLDNVLMAMGKADRSEIISKDLNDTYSAIKSFIYTDKKLLDIENPNEERNRLIYGSNSLGNRWEAYTKTLAGKKNLLSERLLVRRGTTIYDPIRIEALNTPAANTSDTNESMAAYYRMYHRGSEEEKALAKDLANYFILTGAKQGPNSIAKYIPYDILEEHSLSSKLHQLDSNLRSNEINPLDGVVEQFFQHNPSKAVAFDIKSTDIHDYKKAGFTMSPDSKYLIPTEDGGMINPPYMSVYSKVDKDFLLYKLAESTPLGSKYSRIDLLGDKGIDEYNASATTGQYSIIKSNQAGQLIPASIESRVEEDKSQDNMYQRGEPTATISERDNLIKQYNLDNSNAESTLNSIIESNSKYSNVASDLKNILVNYPSLRIETTEDRENVSGAFYPDINTIKLNIDNIVATGADIQRVILHETLHAITANKIANYDNLSEDNKKAVDKLKILYNQYKRDAILNDDYTKFATINAKLRQGIGDINVEDIAWYQENKSKFYSLTSLDEFIAAGLTEDAFTQQLKDNNFWNKLWTTIKGLLGLNEKYNNDYDALYSNVLDLGKNSEDTTNTNSLEDLNPKDAKQEFLSKYHLYDGKPMTANNFDKVNTAMKANDKYKNIKIDLAWENGNRVLRVFTKGGTPLYDINPKPSVPKTKEEKIIEKSLKYYYDVINKFKSNPNYVKNPELQAKVEGLEAKVKQIKEENVVSIITSQAKDNLSNIEAVLDRPGLISINDVNEAKTFLAFYKNIRKIINYNEAFEEENKNLDLISRKAVELESVLKQKELDLIKNWSNTNLNLATNLDNVFNTPVKEVGKFESKWESGAFSTDQGVQFLQSMIRKSEQKSYDEFQDYRNSVKPIIDEFLKKHKDYKLLLQYNKDGEWTGGLLNKYSQSYYDELINRKGKGKEFWKFLRENTDYKITEENKKQFEQDSDILKEVYPDWDKQGTYDYATYNQWYSSHDPSLYISKIKQGKFVAGDEYSKYRRYITSTPTDKWLDPKYKQLKSYGEDSIEMKLYRELDSQFRTMAKTYENNANYIPELKKDFSERILDGEWKGAFSLLKNELQDAISVRLDPTTNFNTLDANGVPNKTIPVYMMSNVLDTKEKSNDLGKILLMAKLQDALLNHKAEVEPYLNSAKELLLDRPAYVTNRSGNIVNDSITGEPEEDTSIGRAPNTSGQINFIVDKFLYDREKEQSGVAKTASIKRTNTNGVGEETVEERAVAASKIMDTVSKYTRLKALGYNPVSSVGRILWGTLSNTIYAGDRKSYNEKANIRAFKAILQWSLPGTAMNKKINHLAEFFNMRQQLNEIKFGKLEIKTPRNPIANVGPYFLVDKGENFIQYHTGVSVLMTQKISDLSGKEYSLFDAFDNEGKWKEDQFGPNPYLDDKNRLDLSTLLQSTITAVHGDYGDAIQANDEVISRQLLVMRRWLPRSISVRFGREYTDINTGEIQKGRYRSYELSHINPLNLIKDFYKAFTIDSDKDNIDFRNLRMNAYELAFIPVLWGAALAMKGLIHGIYHDDDAEKAALTFLLNSTTRVSGDLTFFFNPYSVESVIREPIPAFKTIMDFYDLGPAVLQTIEGKGTYKTGIHKGQSKIGIKLAKAIPIINQPEKAISAAENLLEK